MKAPDITIDEWRQAMNEVSTDCMDTIPSGWITAEQFSVMIGAGNAYAYKKLKLLCNAGRAEAKKFMIMTGGGVRKVSHYRLKKK